MGNRRHEVADDGVGIFDLRISSNFRKRFAGYDKREVELYLRRQEAVMAKLRLEKEQLERQVIRLRQQLSSAREQLIEARSEADTAKAEAETVRADAMRDADSPAAAQAVIDEPDDAPHSDPAAGLEATADTGPDAPASTGETGTPQEDPADETSKPAADDDAIGERATDNEDVVAVEEPRTDASAEVTASA